MKWIIYAGCLLFTFALPPAMAAIPVTISNPVPAILNTYNQGDSTVHIYTITNNVPNSSFPITINGISAPVTRTTVSNDCGKYLPKGPSTCNIGIKIAPTATNAGQLVNQNLSINYQSRRPLIKNISFSVPKTCVIHDFTINENPAPLFPAGATLIPDQAYVIKDDVNYKFYYSGNDFASINLATSPDGITWTAYPGNPVLADPLQAEHADVHYYSDGFTAANTGTNPSTLTMYYRMWYQGTAPGISGWRYAESPDGITWYNRVAVTQVGTPVYSVATGAGYGIADAVYTPGASNTGTDWTFRMYVNIQWELAPYGGLELVVMAFSSNGYVWTGYDPGSVGYATPIFAGTLDGVSFDANYIGWFKVVKNSPTDWQAFYSGGKNNTYQALNGVGYATSTDGINWTRRQTLFTTSDGVPWRNQSTWMPSVVKTSNGYEIYFLGSDNSMIDGSWIWWKLGSAALTPGQCHA